MKNIVFKNFNRFFSVEEATRSATSKRLDIDNSFDVQSYENFRYLVEQVLTPVRQHFDEPLIITSGFRSLELNREIGGSHTSWHLYGCAADIKFGRNSRRTLQELFEYIGKNLPYTELIAEEFPHGWVHVALVRGRENDRRAKVKQKGLPIKHYDFWSLA